MKSRMISTWAVVSVVGILALTVGCKGESRGVSERAGAAVDRAAEKTKDVAGQVVEKTGEAVEKSGEAAKNVGNQENTK